MDQMARRTLYLAARGDLKGMLLDGLPTCPKDVHCMCDLSTSTSDDSNGFKSEMCEVYVDEAKKITCVSNVAVNVT